MRLNIIKIGNSKGIRLPKPVLEDLGGGDVLEGEILPEGLLIRPVHNRRAAWDEAFQMAGQSSKEEMGEWESVSTGWDDAEWEW